ncbi:MAG: hypothetical protein QGF03_11425 [SAR324 cluster bacterium]|jgi:acyl-coenzyme A thioesterase PaaI-like protein|nr:hypothetical protein [SAR324 cluster bacterium]MDP7318762.1 hypothetical protein [SAR324 cluster bacterium]MDP7631165.1 hypothetical protein [SAR324 cluster bacterium]|tara:strand:+ start:269 stop:436 length:168 start_codon:yes stop_codon:yes gene_type:complete
MFQQTIEALQRLMQEQFPQSDMVLEKLGPHWARVRIPVQEQHRLPLDHPLSRRAE